MLLKVRKVTSTCSVMYTGVFCHVHRCDISVASDGKNELTNRLKSKKHKDNCCCCTSLTEMFRPKQEDLVASAECLIAAFVVEYNLAFSLSTL